MSVTYRVRGKLEKADLSKITLSDSKSFSVSIWQRVKVTKFEIDLSEATCLRLADIVPKMQTYAGEYQTPKELDVGFLITGSDKIRIIVQIEDAVTNPSSSQPIFYIIRGEASMGVGREWKDEGARRRKCLSNDLCPI